jgi:hypothetical protein
MTTTCTACHKPLTDPETFGTIDCPMCWTCHSSCMFDGDPPQTINADIFAADTEPQPVNYMLSDAAQQEAAGQGRLL